ncbi:uncharacterized protein LOC141837434 [Curcuma longa]|uniref:uncharacterized protein LOC141837434 n=1 Tax=Curcuma longa TaxID=136217 RepID=UPI003D9E4AF9
MLCEVMAARVRKCSPNFTFVDAARSLVVDGTDLRHYVEVDETWIRIQDEARSDAEEEPLLRQFYCELVLAHPTLESALAAHLAAKLAVPALLPHAAVHDLLISAFCSDAEIRRAVRADLRAAVDRDPACAKMVHCFLYYKGFLALQTHRAAHRLLYRGFPRAAAHRAAHRSSAGPPRGGPPPAEPLLGGLRRRHPPGRQDRRRRAAGPRHRGGLRRDGRGGRRRLHPARGHARCGPWLTLPSSPAAPGSPEDRGYAVAAPGSPSADAVR